MTEIITADKQSAPDDSARASAHSWTDSIGEAWSKITTPEAVGIAEGAVVTIAVITVGRRLGGPLFLRGAALAGRLVSEAAEDVFAL